MACAPAGRIVLAAVSIAILDPFSGIAGDMMLGALVDVGLDPEWVRSLPARIGLDGVTVQVTDVQKCGIACKKVDFGIPPQPHGRHLKELRGLVDATDAPEAVKACAIRAFTEIAEVEAAVHGTTVERVHLHEVGAVDALLDVIGSVWGLSELGLSRVYCGTIALGDGDVQTAHGRLPVPAPATLRLLEGLSVRPGPPGSGELVTPTGAALVRVLSQGEPPSRYIPRRSGYGAGTRELSGRPNALRLIVADGLKPTIIGVVIGLLLAAALGRVMESLLYGVGVHDAVTYAGVALVVTGVGAMATLLPAYRATRVDPVDTLRAE